MRIMIDILTPKHCRLFSKLAERLKERGHEVWFTSREYREANGLRELMGIEARIVGRHGGKELKNKLMASAERTKELIPIFDEIDPDVSISLSPEMARASYGLGVPHVCVNDSPHAEAVARLTVPLSTRLLSPWIIPKEAWARFGVAREDIIQYRALDPWAWIKDLKPDRSILDELELDEEKTIITFRTAETFAAYLLGKSIRGRTMLDFIGGLLKLEGDLQIVVIPRYSEQVSDLKKAFEGEVTLCESIVDGPSLLYYSDIFVGMGGTMNAEAALLGIPTFSAYPAESFIIEKYLIDQGLIDKETDSRKLLAKISGMLDDLGGAKEESSARARGLVEAFEDPLEVISREVERVYGEAA